LFEIFYTNIITLLVAFMQLAICFAWSQVYPNLITSILTFILENTKAYHSQGQIDDELVAFLLTGGVALENPFENPAPAWLSDKAWSEVVRCSNLNGYLCLYFPLLAALLLPQP
jgi:hypothetical protein